MAILKCKMCGGDLTVANESTVCECEYCGSKQTVPTADSEKKMTLFTRANRLRFNCDFDKASNVYEAIVAEFPDEAEAYWGLVLSKYGIEYVDDPLTAQKVPTCHRLSFDSVMRDNNFELVMETADSVSRGVYREQAKQIENIRSSIIEVSEKEAPYDIFICYKETDTLGQRTIDSVIAQDVYDALTSKGYRTFFSRVSLEDKLGQEYEPYIFAALNSAKLMLAFGTSYDNFNAVWVKNEWSRYLKLMTVDNEKHLIPCYKNVDAYDMPEEFARLQAQDMGKVGAIQDLLRGIEKLIRVNDANESNNSKAGTCDSLIRRGFILCEDGEWGKAEDCFERALEAEPENGRAYLGMLLVNLRVNDIPMLSEECEDYSDNINYGRALRYCNSNDRKMLVGSLAAVKSRIRAEHARSQYDIAVSRMDDDTISGYKTSVEILNEIKDEIDCEPLISKCNARISQLEKERDAQDSIISAEIQELQEEKSTLKRQSVELETGKYEYSEKQKNALDALKKSSSDTKSMISVRQEEGRELQDRLFEKEEFRKKKENYLLTLGLFKGKEKKEISAEIQKADNEIGKIKNQIHQNTHAIDELIKKLSHIDLSITNFRDDCWNEAINEINIKIADIDTKISKVKLKKIFANKLRPGDKIELGRIEVEGKDVPISWIVLEVQDRKVLLVTEKWICEDAYNRRGGGKWAESLVRARLNDDLFYKMFTHIERQLVEYTFVDNATEDRLFILSEQELDKYIRDWSILEDCSIDGSNDTFFWWVRSNTYASVKWACSGEDFRFGLANSATDNLGIRPVMWINTDMAKLEQNDDEIASKEQVVSMNFWDVMKSKSSQAY